MPPTPKLGDVSRTVGEIEVDPQIETEDGTQPDGHIAIAREVAIDLQPISQSAHEKLDARVACGVAESDVAVLRQVIGDDGLLDDAHQDGKKSAVDACTVDGLAKGLGGELRHEVVGPYDRAGGEAREEGEEKEIVEERLRGIDAPPEDVDDVTDRAEGVKRQSEGQREADGAESGVAGEHAQVVDKEVGVFEGHQHAEGEDERKKEPRATGADAARGRDAVRYTPVDGRREDEQEEEPAAVVEKEIETEGRDEDFHRRDPATVAQPGVDGQEGDEEGPKKSAGEHQRMGGVRTQQREQPAGQGGEVW